MGYAAYRKRDYVEIYIFPWVWIYEQDFNESAFNKKSNFVDR